MDVQSLRLRMVAVPGRGRQPSGPAVRRWTFLALLLVAVSGCGSSPLQPRDGDLLLTCRGGAAFTAAAARDGDAGLAADRSLVAEVDAVMGALANTGHVEQMRPSCLE